MQHLKGGAYYMLEGVQQSVDSQNYYMDIYLLCEQVNSHEA